MKTLVGAIEPEPNPNSGGYMVELSPQPTTATNHVTVSISPRLRRSRANARAAVSRLWAKDWDSPEDAMWDEWKDESAEWAEATFDAAAETWPD